ncbi:MAG TPA: sugar phosphate isomerase/epimerase [Candidatus Latescibacteria bacterium]|nr:sugar phosphate isomerase/epimerase [Candidatus Latescibacterota bacterium]
MEFGWERYMRVGLVHFMAYPETMRGEGPILETLEQIVEDDFFGAVEVSWIKDEHVKKRAKEILQTGHLAVAYAAQPRLLINKLDLNSLNETERQKAIEEVKKGIEEAAYLEAEGVALLSGPDPGEGRRNDAKAVLVDSLKQLCEFAGRRGLRLELEPFDRDIDKKCLIGPSKEAVEIAEAVKADHPNFGLLLDLSHLPLQNETSRDALTTSAGHLVHVHIGNCVFRDRSHQAYGDQHPRFGMEGGENDVQELKEFLKMLFEIDFIGGEAKPLVSFEVKPGRGESSRAVVANAKRVFREAWAEL